MYGAAAQQPERAANPDPILIWTEYAIMRVGSQLRHMKPLSPPQAELLAIAEAEEQRIRAELAVEPKSAKPKAPYLSRRRRRQLEMIRRQEEVLSDWRVMNRGQRRDLVRSRMGGGR